MSKNSNIAWTTHTWNPVTGCTQVSPGVNLQGLQASKYRVISYGPRSDGGSIIAFIGVAINQYIQRMAAPTREFPHY